MKMNKITAVLSGGVLLLAGASAQAAVIDFTDMIASTTPTNWGASPLTVSQFDGSLGTLTQVDISFTGSVNGEAKAESLDAQPALVTLNIFADIGLDLSSLSVSSFDLLSVGDSTMVNLGAFDGTIDFLGGSGFFTDLSGNANDNRSTTNAADLAFFTGLGSVSFDASATGTSSGSGAGNLITQFATNAGAVLNVQYTYTPTVTMVPEPSSLLLMGLGLVGLAGIGRRKLKA